MAEAAVILRSAREHAHLSARELAARCGMAASTVTRIERGEINPTVATLDALVQATGAHLIIEIRHAPQPPTIDELRRHRTAIIEAVEARGGSNVRVFGSVARNTATVDSDVDLLIDIGAGHGLLTVEQIADDLDTLLPWKVDLLTSGAAHGRLRHVLDDAVPL